MKFERFSVIYKQNRYNSETIEQRFLIWYRAKFYTSKLTGVATK